MELKQGTIAFANLLMPNGKRKARPVVIATPNEMLGQSEKVLVIGISASYRPEDPDIIPLPWRPDGNIHTGLKKPSAICLQLRDEFPKEDLEATRWWIGRPALIELLELLKSR